MTRTTSRRSRQQASPLLATTRTPPRAVRSVVVVERGFVVALGTLAEVRATLNGGGAHG